MAAVETDRLSVNLLAAALILAVLAAACNRPPDTPQDYVARVAAGRAAKDASFQSADDPVPANKKAEFLPLGYFPIDPEYNVLAALKPITDNAKLMMPTSTGQQREMRRVGTLAFTLKGQPMTLTAFVEAGTADINRLFVPFSDMTSGTETYAAGRYLDLDRTGSGIYALDFNAAYHPYCVYNASYECPYPPPENRLKTPIHAGEKFKKS
jgi:uncharacterized protein (DUF1684 family)